MKALVIDAAASCMIIAAKNDDYKVSLSLDLGQKQSQKLLPSIDYLLKEVDLTPQDLDYTALTSGPGTFTGLRLAFSALKAIELANNVPVYAVPSLLAYAFPFKEFEGQIVSVIDAKKDQFFAAIYENGKEISPAQDTKVEIIAAKLSPEKNIFLVGPDAKIFSQELKSIKPELKIKFLPSDPLSSEALFTIAEEMIEQKKEPLADYEGPVYLRKSEAEIKLESESV